MKVWLSDGSAREHFLICLELGDHYFAYILTNGEIRIYPSRPAEGANMWQPWVEEVGS